MRSRTGNPATERGILAVLCTAQLVLVVDGTIVQIANPTIEHALGFDQASLQWTVSAYALTFGGFMLLGGRLADIVGRRRLFVWAMTAFTVASIGAGLSQSATELIVFRAAQGVAGAVVSPTTLSLLAATFSEGKPRQRAYGIWATAASAGGLIGFVLGGAITSFLGWRWIFFVNGPIGAVAVVGALLWTPADRETRRGRLDLMGAIVVTGGLGLVIFGLSEVQTAGWSGPATLVGLVGGMGLVGCFAVIERRADEPLVPIGLLRRRAAVGNIGAALQSTVGASFTFLTALYIQQVLGFPPGRAGLATLPLPLSFAVSANLSARWVGRLGARRLATVGFLVLAGAAWWAARAPTHGSYLTSMLPALAAQGLGLGAVQVPILNATTSGIESERQGMVAALYNMSQRLGGAVGLAVMATVSISAAGALGGAVQEAHGLRVASAVLGGVALAAAAVMAFGLPARSPASDPTPEAVAVGLSDMPLE